MKIKSRRLKSHRGNQGEMYMRNNYRSYNDISSGLNSMDFYQQHQSYSIYSKYKYINSSVKRPMRSNDRRKNSRSISPVLGSEEYMTKKIEQTSAIIMRQLLNPNEQTSECINPSSRENEEGRLKNQTRNEAIESMSPTNNCNKSKTKKSAIYNIDEIQEKIMNHITKLNDGKKKNLINSNMSGYDAVIEQIQKQKRLEISRALRAMCSHSEERKETSDFINSIIPDIGIKIEDLPHDLIEELRNTLDTDPEWYSDDLYYNNPSSDEFSLGSNDIYTDNSVGKFGGLAFKTKPTQIIVKSEPVEFDILCKENGQNSRQTNDSIVNKLNTNNVDKLINSNNFTANKDDNIITISKNDSEITAVTVKKEICEQPEFEYSDNTYKDNQENSTIINELKDEICQNSEYEYGNYSLQTSSDAEKNVESSITEADCLKLNKTNLPMSFVQTETCNATEENDNEKDNTELTQRGLLLSVEKSDKQIIQNETERNTIKNDNVVSVSNTSTQTGEQYETHCAQKCIDHLLTSCYQQTPKNISEAINRMLEIDECVLKLTNYRQSLFTNLNSEGEIDVMETNSLPSVANNAAMHRNFNETNCNKESSTQSIKILSKKHKKRKKKLADLNSVNEISNCEQSDTNCISQNNSFEKDCEIEYEVKPLTGKFKVPNKNTQKCSTKRKKSADIVDSFNLNSKHCEIKKQSSLDFKGIRNQPKHLQLLDLHEKILVIKVAEDKLLVAGTESGKIIFCCLETGHYSKILHICHVPITSLLFWKHSHNTTYMYVGSFDTTLKVYSLHNYSNIETVPLDDRIQCMECSWGYIFIGCIGGSLLRYTLKKKVVEFGDKYSHNSILVLKATQEGARRVLLIGSRNSPVCIRDAMTGLYMRTMEDVISPTVYSLILNKSLLYCGTTNHDILVYSFHDGKLIHRYKATDSKGIGCMKIDRNLLFASCHNGNIYVYDIKENTFISSIQGPGGVILSMEVFENQVIIGTMSFKFISLLIPQHIQQRKICN